MMVCLLRYAYCVGVFSSRKIAQACERNWACMAIVGEDRPDFRPISDFRTLHLQAFCDVFVQGLRIAGEAGLVKRGHVATDGTTRQGNASRHKAMSDGDMQKAGERLREAIEALVTPASQQDAEADAALGSRRGDALPAALARREDRLATIEAAMRRVEARAKAEAEAERTRRADAAAERQRAGKTRRGTAPKAVNEMPEDKAQRSFTDPALPIMQTSKKGWDDCGKAHVSVDGAGQIMVACDVTAAANDTQHAVPMAQVTAAYLEQAGIERPKDAAGVVEKMASTSDRGYSSAAAAAAVEQLGCAPYMATGRQRHPAPEAEGRGPPTTATERMAAKVRPPAGRVLYARRQVIVEPVCGQLKEARGFRRFVRRGLDHLRGEWCLVWVTHNLLTLGRYTNVPSTA